jgi:hypothetical protein
MSNPNALVGLFVGRLLTGLHILLSRVVSEEYWSSKTKLSWMAENEIDHAVRAPERRYGRNQKMLTKNIFLTLCRFSPLPTLG